MNTKNNVLVLLSTYNGEKYLKQQIDSLLNQVNINLNVLIRDDGSTDNTADKIKKIKNEKIKYYYKKHTGVSDSRNFGVEKANGEYIIFLDADDWIANDTFLKLEKIIDKYEPDLMLSAITYVKENTKNKENMLNDEIIKNKNELIDSIISIYYGYIKYDGKYGNCRIMGGKIYKKNFLEKNNIKFPTNLRTFEDGIFTLISTIYAEKIFITNMSYYYHFENPKSVTNTYDDNIFEQCQLIIENIEKVLNKNNIKTEAIYYCCFELLVACLNTFCKIYSKKDAYDILKKYYKKYNKYLKNAENKYLNPKWKIVNTLLKMKFFKTIIFIYSIK